jgi:hypothetical protein
MTTETATTFRVGDRVLIESINEVGIVIEGLDRGQVCVANNGTVRWREIENLTLVERAHYASPGVAMLALTPEVLVSLAWLKCAGQMDDNSRDVRWRA